MPDNMEQCSEVTAQVRLPVVASEEIKDSGANLLRIARGMRFSGTRADCQGSKYVHAKPGLLPAGAAGGHRIPTGYEWSPPCDDESCDCLVPRALEAVLP